MSAAISAVLSITTFNAIASNSGKSTISLGYVEGDVSVDKNDKKYVDNAYVGEAVGTNFPGGV
ncbi:hypothetical protein [Xenorhabdus hominickii]|uniref:Porin n=1 Tax=Xenorhabdus hominickii TaxID=351679 RepID=A0ABN4S628_XENHO|nr:hypothetical protein [Xenorhabdus hominickii]AOM40594.1 hypothetical protein A9255_08330 [Xenorhabdus hominickii]